MRLVTEALGGRAARLIAERGRAGQRLNWYLWTLLIADLRRMELAKAVACGTKLAPIDELFAGPTDAETKVFFRPDPTLARRRARAWSTTASRAWPRRDR